MQENLIGVTETSGDMSISQLDISTDSIATFLFRCKISNTNSRTEYRKNHSLHQHRQKALCGDVV